MLNPVVGVNGRIHGGANGTDAATLLDFEGLGDFVCAIPPKAKTSNRLNELMRERMGNFLSIMVLKY
jgi:hypothetical protein